MARLPQPGSDDGVWGTVLNEYLGVVHESDGTLKSGVVGSSTIQSSSVSAAKLDVGSGSDGQVLTKDSGAGGGFSWSSATAPVTSVAGKTGAVTLVKGDVGLGNVDNTSDANKPVSTAQQTALDAKAATTVTDALDTRIDALESAGIVSLTDAATIATDASAGKHFRVTITANRTLGVPTNPSDGMRRIWEVTASGADRDLALTTGSAGSFELTTNITSPITITSGKTQFIGAIYNATRDRWTVLASQATS